MEQGTRGFGRVRDAARWAETAHRRRPFAALGPAIALVVAGLFAVGAADEPAPRGDVATDAAAPTTTELDAATTTTSPVTTESAVPQAPTTTSTTAPAAPATPIIGNGSPPTTEPIVIETGPPTPAPESAAPPVGADCTPGYDPCIVRGDEDVDCESSDDDGPRRVRGPVYVEGDDPYGLDDDGDGVACDP